jgi:large subunit ribosomal protein L1
MSKRGKKYVDAKKKVTSDSFLLLDALKLLKDISYTKFDASVDVCINLGVDPRKADQNVRGAAVLPNGRGKKTRVVVFAKGDKAVEANKLDIVEVGGEELAAKITGGWLDFDQIIATPDMMAVVGRLGKVLGPRGLMPNPKLGTVTFDVKKAINDSLAGRAEYKVDKAGVIHTCVGKVSMGPTELKGNVAAVVESILKAKPATAKGGYLKKAFLSCSMSPSLRLDIGDLSSAAS